MANGKVTPLSPTRKRGRPAREVQLLINSEKSRFKAMQKIVEMRETAILELDKLLTAADIPPQVRLGCIKEAISMAEDFHAELEKAMQDGIEDENITEEATPETPSEPESLIDWGEFSNFNGTDNK